MLTFSGEGEGTVGFAFPEVVIYRTDKVADTRGDGFVTAETELEIISPERCFLAFLLIVLGVCFGRKRIFDYGCGIAPL